MLCGFDEQRGLPYSVDIYAKSQGKGTRVFHKVQKIDDSNNCSLEGISSDNIFATTHGAYDVVKLRKAIKSLTEEPPDILAISSKLKSLSDASSISENKSLLRSLINKIKLPDVLLKKNSPELVKKVLTEAKKLKKIQFKDEDLLPIYNLMQEIDDVIKVISQFYSYRNIKQCLIDLKVCYKKFIENISQYQGDQYAELFQPIATISALGMSRRIMPKKHLKHILRRTEEGRLINIGDGLHPVNAYKGMHFKILIDAAGIENIGCTDDPGAAMAVADLYALLFQEHRIVPATTLITIEEDGQNYPIQVSLTVSGKGAQSVLEEACDNNKDDELYFDPENFSAHIILSILTDPGDAKPDNYIFEQTKSEGPIRIAAIDNDVVFFNRIFKSRADKLHYIYVRQILYCLPQMFKPLGCKTRAIISSLEPAIIITQWLAMLVRNNIYYQELLKAGVLTAVQLAKLSLPFCLNSDTPQKMHKLLSQLKSTLEANDSMTHIDVLENLQPLVGKYYRKMRENNPTDTALQLFQRIWFADETGSIEHVLRDELADDHELRSRLESYNVESLDHLSHRIQSILSLIEAFLADLDWQTLTAEHQRQIFTSFIGLQEMTGLTIRNSRVINDIDLGMLARSWHAKTLQQISFIRCSAITLAGVSALVSSCPELHVTLIGCKQFTAESLTILAQECDRLTLAFPQGLRDLDLEFSTHLHAAIMQPYFDADISEEEKADLSYSYSQLTPFLIKLGAPVNSQNAAGDTPLHLAVRYGKINVVRQLLANGARTTLTNLNELTPLDEAIKKAEEDMVYLLIEFGAIHCRQPKTAIRLYHAAASCQQTEVDTLIKFARSHQLLVDDVITKIVSAELTYLDLHNHTLSLKGLNALIKTCPNLKTIDLSRSVDPYIAANNLPYDALINLAKADVSEIGLSLSQVIGFGLIQKKLLVENMRVMITSLDIPVGNLNVDHVHQLTVHKDSMCVREVGLSQQNLTAADLISLVNLLETSPTVSLNLKGNLLYGDGVIAIKEVIKKLPLKKLDLSGCLIGLKGAQALGMVIKNHTSLVRLQLFNNRLGAVGTAELINGLMHNKSLHFLGLNQNGLSNEGTKAVARLLCSHPYLSEIDLGYNNIGDEGAQCLLDALVSRDKKLSPVKIRFGGNSISEKLQKNLSAVVDDQFVYVGEIYRPGRAQHKVSHVPSQLSSKSITYKLQTQEAANGQLVEHCERILDLDRNFYQLYQRSINHSHDKIDIYNSCYRRYHAIYKPIFHNRPNDVSYYDQMTIQTDIKNVTAIIQQLQIVQEDLQKQMSALRKKRLSLVTTSNDNLHSKADNDTAEIDRELNQLEAQYNFQSAELDFCEQIIKRANDMPRIENLVFSLGNIAVNYRAEHHQCFDYSKLESVSFFNTMSQTRAEPRSEMNEKEEQTHVKKLSA